MTGSQLYHKMSSLLLIMYSLLNSYWMLYTASVSLFQNNNQVLVDDNIHMVSSMCKLGSGKSKSLKLPPTQQYGLPGGQGSSSEQSSGKYRLPGKILDGPKKIFDQISNN